MPRFTCPSCEASLKSKGDITGRTVKCPKCSHAFVVTSLVPEPPPVVEVLAAPPPPPIAPPLPAITTTPPGKQFVSSSNPHGSPNRRILTNPRQTRRVMFFLIWIAPYVSIYVVGAMVMESLVQINAGHVAANVVAPGLFTISLPAMIWLFIGFYPTKWWVLPFVMSKYAIAVRCPGCRDVIPAKDKWSCGCGYHAHQTTSLFSRKCPSCGATIGHINCPRCDVTILI